MNTQSVISINPTCTPTGSLNSNKIFTIPVKVEKQTRILQESLRIALGVTGSSAYSRRLWAYRAILGSLLMVFGLLFSYPSLHAYTEQVMPGLSYVMLAGGAMITCGFLTRIISVAMGTMLTIATLQFGVDSMLGFAAAVSAAICVMSMICGSGRYSLDTIIYNALSPVRQMKEEIVMRGCSSLRKMSHAV